MNPLYTLPEPLDSGIGLSANKHIYLEIDIPSPPAEELEQKMSPLEDIPIILRTSPPKSFPKSKGSMMAEVSNLLSHVVLEASSCESQQSSPRRPMLWSLPQKQGGLLLPADASSQARLDDGEASLEEVPPTISPINAISGGGSISPLMNLADLQTSANRAPNDLLNTRGSIEARRWRALWDLGVMLCQNESEVATTVKEARVICSWMALDIWTAYSQLILEARMGYLVVVREAKTTRGHLL